MLETLKEWDRELLIFLNNLGSENFDAFWIFITQIESWIFLFVLFLFIFFKYYKKKNALLLAGITIVTFSISFSLKYLTKALIERLRPNNIPELSESIRVLQYPKDFSFFSGHASVSFAVTFFVILSLRKTYGNGLMYYLFGQYYFHTVEYM